MRGMGPSDDPDAGSRASTVQTLPAEDRMEVEDPRRRPAAVVAVEADSNLDTTAGVGRSTGDWVGEVYTSRMVSAKCRCSPHCSAGRAEEGRSAQAAAMRLDVVAAVDGAIAAAAALAEAMADTPTPVAASAWHQTARTSTRMTWNPTGVLSAGHS